MPEIAERIAILEANSINLDRRADAHERNDDDRFNRTLSFAMGMKTEILAAVGNVNEKVDTLSEKVSTLWDDKNKREGAFGLSKIMVGSAGGLIVAAIDWFVKK